VYKKKKKKKKPLKYKKQYVYSYYKRKQQKFENECIFRHVSWKILRFLQFCILCKEIPIWCTTAYYQKEEAAETLFEYTLLFLSLHGFTLWTHPEIKY
jgi:hypothetical protein